MAKLTYSGPGAMGFPMAGRLLTVYKRAPPQARAAKFASSRVGGDPDLREIALGANGALPSMGEGHRDTSSLIQRPRK